VTGLAVLVHRQHIGRKTQYCEEPGRRPPTADLPGGASFACEAGDLLVPAKAEKEGEEELVVAAAVAERPSSMDRRHPGPA